MNLVKFASNQFRRPWHARYVTAPEVPAGHNEVEAISYCPVCLKNAYEKLQLNEMMQLCTRCFELHETHIENNLQHLHDFHEPWETLDTSKGFILEFWNNTRT
jgi:hypothetical protein